MFASIRKIFKNGWNNFVRQGSLTFATLFVLFIALVISVCLYIFHGCVNFLMDEVENQVDMSIFFKEGVAKDDIMTLKTEIENIPEVASVEYISAEQAYENFVAIHEDDAYLEALKVIEINPFLASLRIKTYEPSQYSGISTYLESEQLEDKIYKINDNRREEVINKITLLNSGINKIGLVLIIFLSLVAILVTLNTVRLTIFSQKEEIEIMKLVGASNGFIRGPFMMQGVLCGFFAALISFFFFLLLTLTFKQAFQDLLMGFDLSGFYLNNILDMLVFQILVGVLLGLISSVIAVRKYLKT